MKAAFRLQAVLTVRERQERMALEKYAQALNNLHQARERLATTEAGCAAACARRRILLERGGRACEIHQSDQYSHSLEDTRQAAAADVKAAQGGADAARQEMLDRRQRREVVEKHLNNQRRAHALRASRAEQKRLDELGQLRRGVLLDRGMIEEARP